MQDECFEIRRRIDVLMAMKPQRYQLNVPLSEFEILNFESRYRIDLPSDYREFLLIVGNGGAGPGDGVEKLGQAYGVDWNENPGLVGDLAAPFPYTDRWNATPVDGSLPLEKQHHQQDEYWNSRHVNGAFPVCHYGCNQRVLLIITGPERGNIWIDDRADWQGLYPESKNDGGRWTFSEWYQRWLENEQQRD